MGEAEFHSVTDINHECDDETLKFDEQGGLNPSSK